MPGSTGAVQGGSSRAGGSVASGPNAAAQNKVYSV